MGLSPKHSSTVPLVLNLETGFIKPQFHVVFDDWFSTVSSTELTIPDLSSETWKHLLETIVQGQPLCEDDEEATTEEMITQTDERMFQSNERQRNEVAQRMNNRYPDQPIPTQTPALNRGSDYQQKPVLEAVTSEQVLAPLLQPQVAATNTMQGTQIDEEETSTKEHQSPKLNAQNESNEITLAKTQDTSQLIEEKIVVKQEETNPNFDKEPPKLPHPTPKHPRRSTRLRKPPTHLSPGGYMTSPKIYNASFEQRELNDPTCFKATASDPDTLSFDEAMSEDQQSVEKWKHAAKLEIESLEQNGTWEEVLQSSAGSRILPGTWVFRRKRTPDGEISKYKARYCVRGDLEEGTTETFAPVVAWSSVRLFLALSVTLKWKTCSIDFSNAFVQATLKEPVWIHTPRGFHAKDTKNKMCLKLLKSLYGLSVAPKLWFHHVKTSLVEQGFKQSALDPCLMYKQSIMLVLYVDDVGIAYRTDDDLRELLQNLKDRSLSFTQEGTFTDFLGIKFVQDIDKGTITLVQKGLISKIISATGMEQCNPNWTPTTIASVGLDPDGPPMTDKWNYSSIIGMLLYLSSNTRPDICYGVSQAARFSKSPKKSHAAAIKTMVRYLFRTRDKGMTIQLTGNYDLTCYVDADFAGLHKREPDEEPTSAKSRTGYLITLGGFPILWKSHLQTEISLSTLEAEYSALSSCMRTLIPLRATLLELLNALNIPGQAPTTFRCTVFEDNNGALLLANKQQLTNRTKYFLVKWHFFWDHVRRGDITIEKISTEEQQADYLTKGLDRTTFETIRRLVQGW